MYYEGKIYRPWPEANSLLIQTTIGCTHNRCTFCDMFREKKFRIRELDDIFKDIEEARGISPRIESIFLIDGNVLALKTEFLVRILEKITTTLPECSKISLYAGLNDLRRKSVHELKELKAAGVTMAYTGLESGDSETLLRIKKGLTPRQAEEGMAKAKAAGIEVLISIIFGIGGRERSREHILKTTDLLNILQPEELAPMALAIQPGTELDREVRSGDFILSTPLQILEEEKYLLENLSGFTTYYWGDHGNNVVPMKGWLPDSREKFLANINKAISTNPICKEEVLRTFSW
ncbi:radical SAM protein [Desulforhopalus sp. IMCC35007]|uniref:radical SAM protein n=1 Tax=Desulforhopalus sp. IMCC35007 TaxID=2569543 RepID=UPI0010ADEADC|nr:radical SAM protein [Desulforhopalus sp. IMCC35007]TKB10785.1 radical SAM protein [Desulforhopalus sp. IMCC35007]